MAKSPEPMVERVGPPTTLAEVRKGDLVRLLEPHYDGFQRFEAGAAVRWWNDTPPDPRNACLPDAPATPLEAPPMTDGKPPADYIDPATGKPPAAVPV